MSESVLFVGTYDIPPGEMDAFHSQIAAMTAMIREHEPRVRFIGHYVNEDETEGTSIHLHPDADSFDFHMATAVRVIERGAQMVSVKRIEFYGKPSDASLDLLTQYDVRVKAWADGYSRLDPA